MKRTCILLFCASLAGCARDRGHSSSGGGSVRGTATYTLQEAGISITLPGDYAWGTSDFRFDATKGRLAEWVSADHKVAGLIHRGEGTQLEQFADATEIRIREYRGVRSLERLNEKKFEKMGAAWIIRELRRNVEGVAWRSVSVYISTGQHVFVCASWCDEKNWDRRKSEIMRCLESIEYTLPPPEACTGIYSLQGSIDFDSLDGAAIDPSTGAISLFGHRTDPNRLVPVAYLDHLATAMECDAPTFSLEWVPESEREVDRALNIQDDDLLDKLAHLFDGGGKLTPLGEWWYQLGGAEVEVGMTRYQANAAALRATGRPHDATALLIIEKRDEALTKNDADAAMAYFRLLCKELDIYDAMEELYRRSERGELTETQYLDAGMVLYIGAVAKLFGQDAQKYENMYQAHRKRGVEPQQALDKVAAPMVAPENQKAWLRQVLFRELFRDLSEVHVPPAQCAQILGVLPRVRPRFENLAPHSLLARVALEADVIGKRLMVMPELKKRVPRYRTYFEWRRTVSAAAADKHGHLWFSPDGFELNESADGNAVQFGRTAVRINLRRKEVGRSVEDPVLRQYADELTGLYDEFAREYPVLHELRECMKVVALAGWLKKRGFRVSLPAEGRAYWNPPREVAGIVEIVIAVKDGPVGMMLWALGGVDFDGRYAHGATPAWNFRTSADADAIPVERLTASPLQETNTRLSRYKIDTIDVPMPWTYGECPAEGGRRALKYVTLRQNELSGQVESPEALLQLARVRRKAEMLVAYDRMLNARTKDRSQAKRDLTELQDDARKVMRDFLDGMSGTLFSMGTASGELARIFKSDKAPSGETLELAKKIDEWKGVVDDAKTAVDGYREGTFDAEYWKRASERLGNLGIEIRKQLMELKGASPRVAEYISTRTTLRVTALFAIGDLATSTGEIILMHRMASDLNDQLGDQSMDMAHLQKMRETCQNEYNRERNKYEQMRRK